MKYNHVIWDFNGTILDDVSIGIEAINVMLSSRGLPILDSVDTYRKIFGFPIKEYYQRCGFDFNKEDYESILAPEWVNEYKLREDRAVLCSGVAEALALFEKNNVKQTVISASSTEMLNSQINRLGIRSYFDAVIGCDNFYAYGKSELCCNYAREHISENIILVGDSTHDHEAASMAGIDCALVLSGHMNEQTLSKCSCPLFDNAYAFAKYVIEQI